MPLLWLSLAFLVGSIIADNAVLPTTTWLILAGVSLGLVLVIFIVLALIQVGPPLLTLTLGGLRYQLSLPDFNDPHFITPPNNTGERVTITGVVDSFPDLRDNYLYLCIQTKDIRPYGTTTAGTSLRIAVGTP